MLKVKLLFVALLLWSTFLGLSVAGDTTQGSYVLHRDGHMHWIAVGTDELGRSITLTCQGTTPTVLSSDDVDCFKPDGSHVPSSQIVFREQQSETASGADGDDGTARQEATTDLVAATGELSSRRIVAIAICSTVGLITLVTVAVPLFRRPQHAKATTTTHQQNDDGSIPHASDETVSNISECRGELEISPMPDTVIP